MEEIEKPSTIEEIDALRLENHSLRRDLLQAQLKLLEIERVDLYSQMKSNYESGVALGTALREKYQITDAESIDFNARKIVRK